LVNTRGEVKGEPRAEEEEVGREVEGGSKRGERKSRMPSRFSWTLFFRLHKGEPLNPGARLTKPSRLGKKEAAGGFFWVPAAAGAGDKGVLWVSGGDRTDGGDPWLGK
jgi:hypothetical protein